MPRLVHYEQYIPYTGAYALCMVDDESMDMVEAVKAKSWPGVTCKKCLKLKAKLPTIRARLDRGI